MVTTTVVIGRMSPGVIVLRTYRSNVIVTSLMTVVHIGGAAYLSRRYAM